MDCSSATTLSLKTSTIQKVDVWRISKLNIKKGSCIVMVYILHWLWLYSGDNFPSAVVQPVYTEARRCERNVIFSSYPFSKSDLNDLLSCVYDIFFFCQVLVFVLLILTTRSWSALLTYVLNRKSIHVLPGEFWYLAALSAQDASIMC